MSLAFGLLGPLEAYRDRELVAVRGQRRKVLAVLLIRANRVVAVPELIEALWPSQRPATARQTVQYFIHRLRQDLADQPIDPAGPAAGSGAIATHESGYLLRVGAGELDTVRFQGLAAKARSAQAANDLERAWGLYSAAVGLWRGPALVDFAEADWAKGEIARLEALRVRVTEQRLQTGILRGRHAELLGELERLVGEQPLREHAWALLMLALARSGRHAEALATYRHACATLVEQVGADPGPELAHLAQQIRARDPALQPPVLPDEQRLQPPPPLAVPRPASQQGRSASTGPPAPAAPVVEARRVVTVLACELPGGVGLVGRAQQRQQLLDQAHTEIVRYGGTVKSTMGQQLVAVFGDRQAREDDPERAVRAGLAIAALPASPAPYRVGLETGQALVAGAQVASEATAVAVGLMAGAPAGGVLVGPAAHQASWRRFAYQPRPGGGWRALRPHATAGALLDRPSASSGLVERDRELRLLEHALATACTASAQLVTILGAPGIGKTRLVAEFARRVDTHPELIAWRQTRAATHTTGFAPLADLVASQLGVHPTDPPALVGHRVHTTVGQVLTDPADAAWVADSLNALLQPERAGHLGSDPHASRSLAPAWVRFMEAVAADRPLVLVFEDAHHASRELQDFLEQLLDEVIAKTPLLVVVTARPELLETRRGWAGGSPRGATISLGPLSAHGSRQLLNQRLAAAGITLAEPVRAQVLDRAGGNPFYLEEYVRMLADARPAAGSDDGEVGLPASVGQLIAARLDALLPADRQLLADLAVLGAPATVEALGALAGLPEDAVVAGLAQLETRTLVCRPRRQGRASWGFPHPLIGEVAYNSLMRADRLGRHTRAAVWLEAQPDHPGRLERLAGHYQQIIALSQRLDRPVGAELADRARRVLRAAGQQATRLGALGQAASLLQDALGLWPTGNGERAWVQLELGGALAYSRQTGHELADAALATFRDRGDAHGIAVAQGLLAHLARASSQPRQAAELVEGALVDDAAPDPDRINALAARALNLLIADRHAEAVHAAEQTAVLAERLGLPDQVANVGCMGAHARILAGDLGALPDADRALAAMDRLKVPVRGYAHFGRAHALWWFGELAQCAAAVDTGRAATTAAAAGAPAARLDAVDAGIAYTAGEWDRARDLTRQVLAADHARYLHPWAHVLNGRMHLASGEVTGAAETAASALEMTRQTMTEAAATGMGDVRYWQVAMALAGRVALAGGDRARAVRVLDELLGWLRREPERGCVTPDLGWLLADLALPSGVLPDGLPPTRWHAAVAALATGDLPAAARWFAAAGSPIDVAMVRLRLAQRLAASGHPRVATDADHAAAVFRKAGASALRSQAEALLRPGRPLVLAPPCAPDAGEV